MTGSKSITLWLLLAAALCLEGYGGYLWYTANPLTAQETKMIVDHLYRQDVAHERARVGQHWNPSRQWQKNRRAAERKAVVKESNKRQDRGKSWLIAGLALLIFCAGRLFLVPLARRYEESTRQSE